MLKAIAVPEESAAVKKNKKMEQYWRVQIGQQHSLQQQQQQSSGAVG